MPTKDERREEAAKHIALVKSAFADETQAAIDTAVIYEDGDARALDIPEPAFDATTTVVTSDFATTAVQRAAGKTVVVDPASFTRPGGSYEDGGFGPEQILCSESNLYPVLRAMKPTYHDANRGYQCGQLFTDRAIYLEGIVFHHDGATKPADVIAIPEPNRQRAIENHRSERECDQCLADRVECIMRLAAAHGCETLIVGAFGCGRNPGDEARTIDLFKAWIAEHPGAVATIVFAVPRSHFAAFKAAFGKNEPVVAKVRDAEEDGELDEDDYRNIELPEGVTLR